MRAQYIREEDLSGRHVEIQSFIGSELVLRDLSTEEVIEITLEDSGLGYGEGGYTPHYEMQAFKKT